MLWARRSERGHVRRSIWPDSDSRWACQRRGSVHHSVVPDDPQVMARGSVCVHYRHPAAGRFVQVGIPLHLSVDVPAVKGPAPTPAPVRRRVKRTRSGRPPAPRRARRLAKRGAMKIDSGLGTELRQGRRAGDARQRRPASTASGRPRRRTTPSCRLTLAAEHSSSVSLGTGVAIAFARNPMSLAYTTNQLQEYSGGRVVLGLGSQVRRHIENRFSMTWSRPAARMREYVLALRDHLGHLERPGGRSDRVRRRVLHAHVDDAGVRAAAPRVRTAEGLPRRGRARDERGGGRGRRRRHHPRHLHRSRTCARSSCRRSSADWPRPGGPRRDMEVTCPGFISVVEDDAHW